MVYSTSRPLQLRPLAARDMTQLSARATRLGVAPEDLARELVEEGLALRREAEVATFAQIMMPVRASSGLIEDREVVRLVDRARPTPGRKSRRRRTRQRS